jgi:hypothetical protein
MNVTRGLRRIWLVATIGWALPLSTHDRAWAGFDRNRWPPSVGTRTLMIGLIASAMALNPPRSGAVET